MEPNLPGPIYCIDTSALIGAWYERYKPNRFPKLWDEFDNLIMVGRLVSSSLVLDECSKRSPELHEWLKVRDHMFLPPEADIQMGVASILANFGSLVKAGKQKFAADPFVIATAQVHGYTVVTEEAGMGLGKIPGVCNHLGVHCMNLAKLFDDEDWSF